MVSRRQLLKISALGTATFAAPLAYSASNITMTHKTGNPIGSPSLKDIDDNARSLDLLVSGDSPTYLDRRGVKRKSWAGMEGEFSAEQIARQHQFTAFLDSSGYEAPVPYVPGIELVRVTQTVTYLENEYRAKSQELPFTTTDWATDKTKFILIGDDSLRQELSSPSKAAGMVGWRRKYLAAAIDDVHGVLNSMAVSPWEFAEYAIGYDPLTDYMTWDWRPAIQQALDCCAQFGIPSLNMNGHFSVSLDPTSPAVANAYSAGGVALSIKSIIDVDGWGSVTLMSGSGQSEATIFGNPHVTTILGRVRINIEVNGNRTNTLGQVSGVLLVGVQNPVIGPSYYAHSLSRHGFMVRPNPSQVGMTDTVMEVMSGARIDNVGGIGIQATRVKGFLHYGSRVSNTGDNCIDVYANDPAGDESGGFVGKMFITGAVIDGGLTGIFIESGSDWQILDNDLCNCNGMKFNRINSGALDGRIIGNKIKGKNDLTTSYGMSFSNSSGWAYVGGNTFDQLKDSITCGAGTDRLFVASNTHRRIRRYTVSHNKLPNQIVRSTIKDQYIFEEGLSETGYPQLTPPISNPLITVAQYQVGRGTLRSIAGDRDLGVDFELFTVDLTSPSNWGGAYAIYNVNGDAETRINTSPDVLDLPGYVVINKQAYHMVGSGTAGEYYVRLWNGTAAVAGDYLEYLDAAYKVSVKYAAFATA